MTTGRPRRRRGPASACPVGGLDDVVASPSGTAPTPSPSPRPARPPPQYLRELSWQLEGTGIELLVSPGLIEVAGPRLHIRPFVGLPLLAVEQPLFEGWQRLVKGAVDRWSPLWRPRAVAPVLLGHRGWPSGCPARARCSTGRNASAPTATFTMLKFRSMVVDAERGWPDLLPPTARRVLFKMRATRGSPGSGAVLRRFSLDELPSCSTSSAARCRWSGPRPPLPNEVARYDSSVRRRLLVKPGLTGLWQISGRSDLPWEEAVRLDLRYVENWIAGAGPADPLEDRSAVVRSRGAY